MEARLDDGQKTLESIEEKLDVLAGKQANGFTQQATSQVKAQLLYWVLGIAGAGLIGAIVMGLTRKWFEG